MTRPAPAVRRVAAVVWRSAAAALVFLAPAVRRVAAVVWRSAAAALVFLACAWGVSGCGVSGSEPVPAGPPASKLRIGMQEYAFQVSAGAIEPGTVTVVVTNAGSAEHDVVLTQDDREIGHSDVLSPGERQTLEVQAAAGGPVHLECTLAGHSAAGMHASVSVAGG